MRRMSFKPDSSFYRKLVVGAVGARAVRDDLQARGHQVHELERGSTDTKVWKDVKRKRVRIPDLVCSRCGARIECRAKTKPELAMSHSPDEAERSWDYGMVDDDWVAFPVCTTVGEESNWSVGRLHGKASYWHERSRANWEVRGAISYLRIRDLRAVRSDQTRTKGVEEASETTISWAATFSTRNGTVERTSRDDHEVLIRVRRTEDRHVYTWRAPHDWYLLVEERQQVREHQLLASRVRPIPDGAVACPGALPAGRVSELLGSRNLTLRFTGVKLARWSGDLNHSGAIRALADDEHEDPYVRLEAAVYLELVEGGAIGGCFRRFLEDPDPQTQLEAVIALGDAGTEAATERLAAILADGGLAPFLRSAAAWSLGQIASDTAQQALVRAFSQVDTYLREEALDNLTSLGEAASAVLAEGMKAATDDVIAGCAEALRQMDELPLAVAESLGQHLATQPRDTATARWAVWLLGHQHPSTWAPCIAALQEQRPDLQYAMSVVWAFASSWISRRWELVPKPVPG